MGDTGHFDMTVSPGRSVEINWGDGQMQTKWGTGEVQHFQHRYKLSKKHLPLESFVVSINAEEDGTILSYHHGFIDMRTIKVCIDGCKKITEITGTKIGELKVKL
ncbi:MAG: hypothetical protein Q4D41_00595 [Prevotellaceae bacterium]|nr:hypothetical protein [Prevotellaceae bacterium]